MNRYDVWVIAAIWFAVVVVGGYFVPVDENGEALDPDKEINVAVLGIIAGGLMTGAYVLVRKLPTRTKKETGHLSPSTSESGADLRARKGVVDVLVLIVLWFAGAIVGVALFSDTAGLWLSFLAPLAYVLLVPVRQIRRSRSERPQDAG